MCPFFLCPTNIFISHLSHLLSVLVVRGSSSLLVYIFTSVLLYVCDVLFLCLFVLPLFLLTCCQILPSSLLFLFCFPFGTIAFLSPVDDRRQLSKMQNYASVHTLYYFLNVTRYIPGIQHAFLGLIPTPSSSCPCPSPP